MQKNVVATHFQNNYEHLLLVMLVSAAALMGIFTASIARAAEPQPIIVADLFSDLQRTLEKSARDAINSGGTRREENPTTNQPVPSSQYPEQTAPATTQTKKDKKQAKGTAPGQVLPDLPFIERDKEIDLNTGKWRLKRPFPLYAKEGDTTSIKTLPAGTKLDGLSLAVHTLSYEVVEIGKPRTIELGGDNFTKQGRETFRIPLQRGDKIATLSYYGEGECRKWFKGRVYVGDCSGNEPTEPTDRLSGVMNTDRWALVRTSDGSKGWLWLKGDKIYESIQGISRHDEDVK